jgi:hypothetical protein
MNKGRRKKKERKKERIKKKQRIISKEEGRVDSDFTIGGLQAHGFGKPWANGLPKPWACKPLAHGISIPY